MFAVDVAHHVTQRGNARQFILTSDAERMVYLDLLRKAVEFHALSVIGYCLMSNHIHLVVIPRKAEALAEALKQAHGRYATYWNAVHASSGQAWQGRFCSCPLDSRHLWEALRYAELNPVRAGLVEQAELWPWLYGPPIGGGNDPPNTVDLNGTVAGNMLTVSQYHAPCFVQGIGLTGGVESGNGTLTKQ